MKKLIYFFVFLLMITSCKKNTQQNALIVNASKDLIKEMNFYEPDVSQIDMMVSSFQKEKIAYQEHKLGLKDLVIIGDRPIDLALFQIEAVLNYERGNIIDTTLKYLKTESTAFTIEAKGYDALGKVLLDGGDVMDLYSDMEAYAINNGIGEELIFINITLEKMEGLMAFFKFDKEIGLKNVFFLGNDYFPSTQPPVLALDRYLCDGMTVVPKSGIELIDSKIFINTGAYQACFNGGDVIIYNISTEHISYDGWYDDPIYGWGQWHNKGLMYFKNGYGGWPNTCMDYNELNTYLDGARYIYQTVTSDWPSNKVMLGWHLEGGKGVIQLTTPWTYQVNTWFNFTSANWYCSNMPY